jgi:hypothetical protein
MEQGAAPLSKIIENVKAATAEQALETLADTVKEALKRKEESGNNYSSASETDAERASRRVKTTAPGTIASAPGSPTRGVSAPEPAPHPATTTDPVSEGKKEKYERQVNGANINVLVNNVIPYVTIFSTLVDESTEMEEMAEIITSTLYAKELKGLSDALRHPYKAKMHIKYSFVEEGTTQVSSRSLKAFDIPVYEPDRDTEWRAQMIKAIINAIDVYWRRMKEEYEFYAFAQDFTCIIIWHGDIKPVLTIDPMVNNILQANQAPQIDVEMTEIGCNKTKKEIWGRGDVLFWSPKTEDSTCLLRCVIHGLKLHAPIIGTSDNLTGNYSNGQPKKQKRVGTLIDEFNAYHFVTYQVHMNYPIAIKEFWKVCDYFSCIIEVYTWDFLYDRLQPFTNSEGHHMRYVPRETNGTEPTLRIFVEAGHAHLIYKNLRAVEDKNRCGNCGVLYKTTHTRCDWTKIAYMNKKLPKRMDYIAASEKFTKYLKNDYNVFFDAECFTNENGEHTPYAMGWMYFDIIEKKVKGHSEGVWKYKEEWGYGCAERFITWCHDRVGNRKQNKHPKLKLIGFNNANYDNMIIAKVLVNTGVKFDFRLQNSSLIVLSCDFMETWDLCRFMPGFSLDSAAKSLGAPPELQKSHFPHKFVRDWEILTYEGVEPGAEWYFKVPDDLKSPNWAPAQVWNLKERCLYYLKKDVEATQYVFEKLQTVCHETLGVDIRSFITASHMSYEVWTNLVANATKNHGRYNPLEHLKKLHKLPIPNLRFENIIRQAIYGGRTYNTVYEYKSADYDTLKEKLAAGEQVTLDSIEDYMMVLDVVSLYATAMKDYQYPTGDYRDATREELLEIDAKMRLGVYDEIPAGYYRVSYVSNKTLKIPIMPRKVFDVKDNGTIESKGLIWDLKDVDDAWYAWPDIQNGLERGYEFQLKEAIIFETKGYVFKEYIDLALKLKVESEANGNEVLRILAKLLCNALYGKMLQRLITENTAVIETSQDMDDFLVTNELTDIVLLHDEKKRLLAVGEGVEIERMIRKCVYLGGYVLAYSRKIMHGYADIAERPFDYSDTDSLCFRNFGELKEKYAPVLRQNVPGYLWYDIKGPHKVVAAYFLGPKTYLLEYFDGKSLQLKKRSKGIPSDKLTREDFSKMVERQEYTKKSLDLIRKCVHSKGEEIPFSIVTKRIEKCLIKCLSKARYFISKTESLPYYHADVPVEEVPNDEDIVNDEVYTVDQ